jgi:hypothetical protein
MAATGRQPQCNWETCSIRARHKRSCVQEQVSKLVRDIVADTDSVQSPTLSEPFPWLKGVVPTSDGSSSLTLPCLAAPHLPSPQAAATPVMDIACTSSATWGALGYPFSAVHRSPSDKLTDAQRQKGESNAFLDVSDCYTTRPDAGAAAEPPQIASDSIVAVHNNEQPTQTASDASAFKLHCVSSGETESTWNRPAERTCHASTLEATASTRSASVRPFSESTSQPQSSTSPLSPKSLAPGTTGTDVHTQWPPGTVDHVDKPAEAQDDGNHLESVSISHGKGTSADVQASRAHAEREYFRERAALGSLLSSGTSNGDGPSGSPPRLVLSRNEEHNGCGPRGSSFFDSGPNRNGEHRADGPTRWPQGQGGHSTAASPVSPGTYASSLTQPDDLSMLGSPSRATTDLDRILQDSSFWKS